jgi:hypothetical protein
MRRAPTPRRRSLRRLAALGAVGLLFSLAARPATAQAYDPLAPGWRLHIQFGSAWSSLTGVDPAPPDGQTLGSRRGSVLSVRVSRLLIGPIAGFVEGGTSARGVSITAPVGTPIQQRTSWFDGTTGLRFTARCFGYVCPSLDAGAMLSYNRSAVSAETQTGRPTGRLSVSRYERFGLVGIRVAIPAARGVSVVARQLIGFSELPTDGSLARTTSRWLMVSVPLNQ